MDQSQLKWIAHFIWNIADDRLRDVYVRGKYRDVILPFTVLRRLDAVLEATKDAVLERKKFLDEHDINDQEGVQGQIGFFSGFECKKNQGKRRP
jgi:type I restriction enzyme M protein